MANFCKKIEEPEIPYMPENATENRISSAAHTQKLIANFSCPKCSKFGLKTTQSNINLFQTKVDVYCKFQNQKNNEAGGTKRIIREQKKEKNKKRIIENSDFVHTPERSPKKRRKTYIRNPS